MNMLQPNLLLTLTQYQLIEVVGTDAEKYLQGQLTCDVAKLLDGEQTLTCHCDPKGKMSALFRLCRQNAEQFFMVIAKDLLPEALTQFKKYAVFSKIAFNEIDTPIYAIINATSDAKLAEIGKNVTAFALNDTLKRTIFWGDIEPEINGSAYLWTLIDIQQGVPQLHQTNQFELIPQAVNLQYLERAISFTKGCYIGQETVARAKYRGANKRAMFTFVGKQAGDSLPKIADAIEIQLGEHWKSTGTILECVADQGLVWLQVVMNKEIEPDAKFRVSEMALERYDLPYTLDCNE